MPSPFRGAGAFHTTPPAAYRRVARLRHHTSNGLCLTTQPLTITPRDSRVQVSFVTSTSGYTLLPNRVSDPLLGEAGTYQVRTGGWMPGRQCAPLFLCVRRSRHSGWSFDGRDSAAWGAGPSRPSVPRGSCLSYITSASPQNPLQDVAADAYQRPYHRIIVPVAAKSTGGLSTSDPW